jgi:hypothetical protein
MADGVFGLIVDTHFAESVRISCSCSSSIQFFESILTRPLSSQISFSLL